MFSPQIYLRQHHHNSNLTGTKKLPRFVPFRLLLPRVMVLNRRYLLADSGKNCDSHFSYSIDGGLTYSVDIVIFGLTIRDPFLIRTPFLFLEQFELHKMKPNKTLRRVLIPQQNFHLFPHSLHSTKVVIGSSADLGMVEGNKYKRGGWGL